LSSETNITCYFSKRCYNCPKNKIPHIVHLTNQYWMNKRFPYTHESNPQEKKYWKKLEVFGVLVATETTRKKCLG
jgi:hypothetical protein